MPCPETCWGSPCWCARFNDRFSTSIVNAQMVDERGRVGMYSMDNPGFIFAPDVAKVFCAYPADGGSESKNCEAGQEGCLPGCGAKWCKFNPAIPHNMDTNCAWPAADLQRVLQLQAHGNSRYNEVVVDAKAFVDNLPRSIEAIFYVKGSKAEDEARRVHADFLATFGETSLSARRVPLLEMDMGNPDAPFKDVTTKQVPPVPLEKPHAHVAHSGRDEAGNVGGVGQRCGGGGWKGGAMCPPGLVCNRTNEFWWDCQHPTGQDTTEVASHATEVALARVLLKHSNLLGKAEVVERINTRFTRGHPTSDLQSAGLIIHQFHNGMDGDWKAWMPCPETCWGSPCWCARFNDRFSTSIVNAQMVDERGRVGMYSMDNPGFIFAPDVAKVFCAYPADGGSESKNCEAGQEGCLPGCGAKWCKFNPAIPHNMDTNCAWPAADLQRVLQLQAHGNSRYNEVVVDAKAFVDNLPRSIEAIFYVKGSKAEDEARRVHADFLATFAETSRSARRVPLLEMDMGNPDMPFKDVTHERAVLQGEFEVLEESQPLDSADRQGCRLATLIGLVLALALLLASLSSQVRYVARARNAECKYCPAEVEAAFLDIIAE